MNTTQPTVPTFHESICRTGDTARAERFRQAIHGRTYMDFQVSICPAGGEWEIWVHSYYDASPEEIRGMLLAYMAGEIMRGRQQG